MDWLLTPPEQGEFGRELAGIQMRIGCELGTGTESTGTNWDGDELGTGTELGGRIGDRHRI
ncbi:MAG: hypothetical protein P1U77_26365, partial [Rubripirellula sp.]|nr:hypothetical protein [Rubripirellula sp.]